jgi:hypothetical protein
VIRRQPEQTAPLPLSQPASSEDAPARRWGTILPPVAVVLLGLSFGLIPLFRGELFLFNDNGNEYYPHTKFLVDALRNHVIPQWWSQAGTGIPVIAEGEAHYTPIRLILAFLLSAPASFMAEISLYFALAGLGTHLFLRRLGLHPLAASAGAIGFMFGSQFVVYVRDMGLLRAACFLPWVMWLAETSFQKRSRAKPLWIAPPVIALQFLSGNPVFAVITLVALFSYVLFRGVLSSRDLSLPNRLTRVAGGLGLWVIITALGLGMAGVQVVPTMQHVKESVRAGGLTLEYAANSNHSKITDVAHALFPYVYDLRNPVVAVAGFYDGALIAVAVLYALYRIRRAGAPAWCLALSGGLATLIALGSYTPVYGLLWRLPMMNGMRFPLRYQFWCSFCFACLGAIGLDAACKAKGGITFKRFRPVLPAAALVLALAAFFWRLRPARHVDLMWCLLLLAAAGALFVGLLLVKRPLAVLLGINVLLVADLAYFRSYAGYAPPTEINAGLKPDGLAGWLRGDPDRFRILSLLEPEDMWRIATRPDLQRGDFRLQNILNGSAPPLWDLESVKYHGSLELRRFEKVIENISTTLHDEPDQAYKLSPFLDLLQTKYVVARREVAFGGWEKAREEGGMAAWRIPEFRGGEFLVGSVERENTSDDDSIVREIRSRSIDYRQTAIVAAAELPLLNGLGERTEVRRLPPQYDAMGFHVVSDRRALLVIPSNYYPGWTATVNGRSAPIYRTNWIGMGVLVGPGESNVAMRFTTPGLWTGALLSAVSLVLWLAIAVWWRRAPLQWFARRGLQNPNVMRIPA